MARFVSIYLCRKPLGSVSAGGSGRQSMQSPFLWGFMCPSSIHFGLRVIPRKVLIPIEPVNPLKGALRGTLKGAL